MTQQEFVEKYKHVFGGILTDAMTRRDPSHAWAFTQTIIPKVERMLLGAFADLTAKPPAAAPAQPKKETPK